jgi:hypothetical protein
MRRLLLVVLLSGKPDAGAPPPKAPEALSECAGAEPIGAGDRKARFAEAHELLLSSVAPLDEEETVKISKVVWLMRGVAFEGPKDDLGLSAGLLYLDALRLLARPECRAAIRADVEPLLERYCAPPKMKKQARPEVCETLRKVRDATMP